MKKILSLIILVLILALSISCSKVESTSINITPNEQNWLDQHPIIYYAADPEFAPYEYFEDGVYKGIISDYFKLIEDKLDIKVVIVDSPSWSHSIKLGRNNEIDFMLLTKTADRENFFYFTEHFLSAPNVILVNDTSSLDFNMDSLEEYNIGVLREYSSNEYFKLVHPSAKTTEFETITDGLLELSYGNIDAFLVDLGQASYYINKLNISHLSISETIDFEYKFSLAVPKENKELLPLLDKVVKSISETDHIQIRDKWIQSQYKDWFSKERQRIIYFLFFALLIIASIISIWTIMLRRLVKQKTSEFENLNYELENRVEERTEELSNLNYELEASLDRLIETQEELLRSRKYEALGKLISGVAHEINTPLGNAITSISYSHRLISHLEESLENNNLDKIKLKETISDLYSSNYVSNDNLNKAALIISKFKLLEISKVTKNIKEIDLNAVINMSVDNMIYQNLISENVKINIKIANNISLRSPVAWIQEISTNIILNSIQHNANTPINVDVSAKKHENASITIIFEDDGIGIPDNDHKRIFDPFYTKKSNSSNIGLGLSIAHNIVVSNLHGSIKLDSEFGKYTRFTINIPKQN